MQAADARRAVAAASSTATALGLAVDDAVVLNDSNRLVVRLAPCDVVARVALTTHHLRVHHASAAREVEVAHRLAVIGGPVAPPDPRVEPRAYERDGFEITLWTHLEPATSGDAEPAEYAQALERLHAGLRQVDVEAPHVTDRIAAVRRDVDDRDVTPDLAEADRALLAGTLHDLTQAVVARQAPEQLLHGEPHPWNVLGTDDGLRFVDFENAARGPVEYDLAWVPTAVTDRCPGIDHDLLGECRGLVMAIITMHRWRLDDEHPSGREGGVAFLEALRAGPPWQPDAVTW